MVGQELTVDNSKWSVLIIVLGCLDAFHINEISILLCRFYGVLVDHCPFEWSRGGIVPPKLFSASHSQIDRFKQHPAIDNRNHCIAFELDKQLP